MDPALFKVVSILLRSTIWTKKKLQLSRFLEIPETEVVENVQNPKSNRATKPGYSYSKDYVNTNATLGYDTPKGRRDKDNLKTG
jgi:hypothetical protein